MWEHCRLSRRYVNFAYVPCGKWLAHEAGNTSTLSRHLKKNCSECRRIINPELGRRTRLIQEYVKPERKSASSQNEESPIERELRLNTQLKDGLAALVCSGNIPVALVDNVHCRGVLESAFLLGRTTNAELSLPHRTKVGEHLTGLHTKMQARVMFYHLFSL